VGPSAAILDQVDWQERHDPRLNAPGSLSIAGLPIYRATDLEIRDLIDVEGMLRLVAEGADYVFIVPSIGLGGGEKYMTQLADTISQQGRSRTLMLVTQDAQEVVDHHLRTLRRHELVRVRLASLKDLMGRTWKGELVLALLLIALHPRAVFVANTETGFRAITEYGRSLSQVTSLVAAFFSESPKAIGAPYSARYADLVADHASLLSDNASVLDQIGRRLLPRRSFADRFVLPQFVRESPPSVGESEARLREARRARQESLSVLWVSRWEVFKNVEALMSAAELCPGARFTAFGPGQEGITTVLPNLALRGPMLNVEAQDLSAYDCFLFTSQFEGMPNIVLEMVARGIPVVAPRVGGLNETFSENGLWFYENGESSARTAEAIKGVLETMSSSSSARVAERCQQAQEELRQRHSMPRYAAQVRELLQALDAEGLVSDA
jgi:glycosyltransferase involved in cell wall biosynthesis